MLKLVKIVAHGSRQGKATGYQVWPGFIMAHFDAGAPRFLGDISIDAAIEKLSSEGVDVEAVRSALATWTKTGQWPKKV